MKYKTAVASSDGKFVNQHFGGSKQFLIFEIGEDGYRFLEIRENDPPCSWGEHTETAMQKTIELLSDCMCVIVSQIGPGAEDKLKSKGILPLVIPNFIDEALQELIDSFPIYG
ncbi:MAG: dinitrogenase iron-molybdenum cofactor biosynthesis protein [Peptococcaceae bacterium]|nr:dinitrogenase iron-molybdenum cofactor biosynthesis protein [Peptococcaceae bacterium]